MIPRDPEEHRRSRAGPPKRKNRPAVLPTPQAAPSKSIQADQRVGTLPGRAKQGKPSLTKRIDLVTAVEFIALTGYGEQIGFAAASAGASLI
jgi:hypothetical protein